jgi:ligand-binding sensor domain-containing protein
VNVAEGTNAAASVTYSRRAGTGGLWVTYFFFTPQTVVQYSAAQLAGSSTASPAVAVTTNGAESVGVAFDASGNLWTSVSNIPELLEYSASQLASSNTSAPTVILTSDRAGSLNSPAGLAFDSNGNLWVANASSNTLVEYASAQLASSGSPIPIITIGSSSESLQSPYGLAFDASGSLWITTTGPSPVVALAPDQLLTSGAPTPAVSLSFPGISGFSAQELAFDAKGNLWVGLTGVNAIAEIPAAALATTGAPFPSVVLTSGNGSINDPAGLAFDDSGDLWVANSGGTTVVEFTPGQLLASGSPKPVRTITGDLPGPFGLAFDPHAANLPLKP